MSGNAAAPSAPGQGTPTTIEVSPQMAAAAGDDFAAFDRAEQAVVHGKPEPKQTIEVVADPVGPKRPNARPADATAAPAAGAKKEPTAQAGADGRTAEEVAAGVAETPDNRRTRQDKEQQRINDAIRMGIEAGLAAHGVKAPAAEKPAQPAAPDLKAEAARYAAMPDAPKLEEYDSLVDHGNAMAVFVAKKMLEESRTAEARTQLERDSLSGAQKRVDTFLGRLEDAKKDPQFTAGLSDEVRALKPFGALQAGEPAGPQNFVAEEVMDSEIAPQLLTALSKPGELARVLAMPPIVANIQNPVAQKRAHMAHMRRLLHQLEGQLIAGGAGATAQAQAETTTTKPPVARVPPPTDSISKPGSVTNPRQAAINGGDFAAFDAIEQEANRARMARGR